MGKVSTDAKYRYTMPSEREKRRKGRDFFVKIFLLLAIKYEFYFIVNWLKS